ncbi:MAG: hypothetical protein IT204_25895 [Fimbriimonadaceae bacterium]|nr:hypothetical protein [Fimbriimonadaceae bacterium]
MLLAGAAATALTGGLDLPWGGRVPRDPGCSLLRDPLWARALYLDDTYRQVALVQVDLHAVDLDLVRAAGRLAWEAVRLTPGRVLVVPSGVQTAPLAATWQGWPARPAGYVEYLIEQIAAAMIYAARNREPVSAGWSPLPSGGAVLRLEPESGAPALHLSELPWLPVEAVREQSAGYAGVVESELARLDPGSAVVGVLGGAADRPAAREPAGLLQEGRRLAGETYLAAQAVVPAGDLRLAWEQTTVTLAYDLPAEEQAAERLAAAEDQVEQDLPTGARQSADRELELARQAWAAALRGQAYEREFTLTGVGIGDGCLVAAPWLLSGGAAELARAASAYGPRTAVASGVNGLLGLLATPQQPLSELAAWHAPLPFAVDAAQRWAAAVGQLTAALQQQAAEAGTEATV